MLDLLIQASIISQPTTDNDHRAFWLGCIGIREDGTRVSSKNGNVEVHGFMKSHEFMPASHAEGRVLRKLGKNGIVYVSRLRRDGSLAMARPCGMCQVRLRSYKVKKVYYTINDNQYGVWFVNDDYDKIFDC